METSVFAFFRVISLLRPALLIPMPTYSFMRSDNKTKIINESDRKDSQSKTVILENKAVM